MPSIQRPLLIALAIVLDLTATMVLADEPKEAAAEDPSIVTSELDKLDLVVKARPILPEITAGDPLRIAVHFEKKTGPVEHSDQELAHQMIDRLATIDSMDVAIKAPGGKWELFKPAAPADAPPRQSMLSSDGTMLLELGAESIKSLRIGGQEEFALPWQWDGKLAEGEYQIAIRGTLKLSTRERKTRERGQPEVHVPATATDIEFRTKPISVSVKRADMTNQTLDELAEAAVEVVKSLPIVKEENLTVLDTESIAIADADGNRVIRVRANLPPLPPDAPRIGGGRGYWQYEVAMTPAGKPATIARWRKGFCVARGTMISTPDGDVAVEDLHSGRQVFAYDLKNETLVPATVLAVLESRTDETTVINDRLRLSHDHPVLVVDDAKHRWTRATELRVDDIVLNQNRKPVRITTVETIGGEIDLFDVAVDGPHNFFAAGLLVHNKSIAWTPRAFVPWYALWNRAPVK